MIVKIEIVGEKNKFDKLVTKELQKTLIKLNRIAKARDIDKIEYKIKNSHRLIKTVGFEDLE